MFALQKPKKFDYIIIQARSRMDTTIVKQTLLACALAIGTLTLGVPTANAQAVVLTSNDGSTSLRGQLIEFTDEQYTIETLVGTLTLNSANVTCTGNACPKIKPQVSELTIEGAGTLAGFLVADLLPGYAQSLNGELSKVNVSGNPTYTVTNTEGEVLTKITLADSSSTTSLTSLLKGQATIALTSRPIKSAEASEFENTGVSIRSSNHEQVIGLDAIAIVTAKENPIDTISIRDAALVFSGAYSNWSELGGVDAPIKLYGAPAESELTDLFITRVIESQGDDEAGLSVNIVATNDVTASVSKDPYAIGYTHFSRSQQAKSLAIRDVCGPATPVNNFTIKAEEYPLTQRLYAYSKSPPSQSHANDLLRYLQSDAGQVIVASHGIIDQRGTSNTVYNQGMRFANAIYSGDAASSSVMLKDMVTQIIDSDRLSTTFRFEMGSNRLDQRAKADITRLVEKLRTTDNPNTIIRLFGFTDSVGDFELNQEVSLRRANQVRDALLDVDATLVDRVNISQSPVTKPHLGVRSIDESKSGWATLTYLLPSSRNMNDE